MDEDEPDHNLLIFVGIGYGILILLLLAALGGIAV